MSSAVLEAPQSRELPQSPAPPPPVPRGGPVALHGVTWEEYSRLRDVPENDQIRMAYSDGVLLLMTIHWPHERIGRMLNDLVSFWTVECDVPRLNGGSLTMQSELTRKGIEPDHCWYFTHIEQMKRETEFDADRHPPFDVAVEIDLTTYSHTKLDVYQALGVRELWFWKDDRIRVLGLTDDGYVEQGASSVHPEFPLDLATEIIRKREGHDDTELAREFIKRLRKHS